MSYFDFPHTRNYDSDLSFLIDEYQRLLNKVEELIGKIDEGDVATLQDLSKAIAPILQQIQNLNETIAPISQQITQLESAIPTKTSQLTNDSDFVNTLLPPSLSLLTIICLSILYLSSFTWEIIPTRRLPSVRPLSAFIA